MERMARPAATNRPPRRTAAPSASKSWATWSIVSVKLTARHRRAVSAPDPGSRGPAPGCFPVAPSGYLQVMTDTLSLETPEATLVYDVRGPVPPAAGQAPLFMVGAPMD